MSGVPADIDVFRNVMFRRILLPPSSGTLNFTVTDNFLFNTVSTSAEFVSAKIKRQFFWLVTLFVWVRTFHRCVGP
jgi:hypothetical protein